MSAEPQIPPLLREGVARERACDWAGADDAYARAFEAALREVQPRVAMDALRGQSRMRSNLQRFEEAEEVAELSRTLAELHGDTAAAARAINTLAVSLYRSGDWQAAREHYTAALDLAVEIGDDSLVGWISQNLGVLENLRGNLTEARLLYLECVGSSLRAGDGALARSAYNNLGMVCSDLHEWMEAEIFLDRGLELAERAEDVPLLAKLCVNRAEPLIELGEAAAALGWLERARSTAERIGDVGTLVDVERWLARLARDAGEVRVAEERIQRALTLATEHALELERAECLRESAEVRHAMGSPGAALEEMARAAAAFAALGASRDEELARARIAAWEGSGGGEAEVVDAGRAAAATAGVG